MIVPLGIAACMLSLHLVTSTAIRQAGQTASLLPLVHLLKCWLWCCRDSKQARREAVDMGVGRRSTYKMDNNGKRISKGARLSVPGARFDGAQVTLLLPSPNPYTPPAFETAQRAYTKDARPSVSPYEHPSSPTFPPPPLCL